MAEKAPDGLKESSQDINNLSDNEFHNLLEEAFSMTSVKLHDKSPMLQKLLHEVKPDDDDLKTNIKQKIGVAGVRSALGKKRSERKSRCKEESAASRTTQGGSLQNLHRKLEYGDVRTKNKLRKSGSLNCFTLMAEERLQRTKHSSGSICSVTAAGDGDCMRTLDQFFERKGEPKKQDIESNKSAGYSSQNKCAYTKNDFKKSDSAGSTVLTSTCKEELVPTDVTSVLSWDGDIYPPGTREIEMMELDHSDDERDHIIKPLEKLSHGSKIPWTTANCYSVIDHQIFSGHSGTSLIKNNNAVDEVDASISLPLVSQFHKEPFIIPDQSRSDFLTRTFNGESNADDCKRSNGRSFLDVNGNPLSDVNSRKTYTGFSHSARKEGSDALDPAIRKSKRTKGTHKEVRAGDLSGNIGDLSIDELVEYITSTDKKGKTPVKNLLNENKKAALKNNKLSLPRIRKNEKENNKRNLSDVDFVDMDDKGSVNSLKDDGDPVDGPEQPTASSDKDCGTNTVTNLDNTKTAEDSADAGSVNDKTFYPSCDDSPCDAAFGSENLPNEEVAVAEEAGFHIVTKKQRRNRFYFKSNNGNYRNRRVSSGVANSCDLSHFGWHYNQKEDIMLLAALPLGHCGQRSCMDSRRKSTSSVPPSDHSSVDNSDLDSVHSLPVKSTTVKPTITKTSSSSSCTPQASYADIAKMSAHSLHKPDLPIDSLPKKRSTSLLNVEVDSLLDSFQAATLDNKRDASTSTSEDGCSSGIQYEVSRNSLSHAASYPSLAEAASLSNESSLSMQSTSASVTTSCETFYRINLSYTSKASDKSLMLEVADNYDSMTLEKSPAGASVNITSNESSLSADTEESLSFPLAKECVVDIGDNALDSVCSSEITKLHKSKSLDESSLTRVSSSQCNGNSKHVTECGAAASVLSAESKKPAVVQPSSQEKANVKTKKKTQVNRVLPAVIILHKHEPLPNDIELTFGFELNEQLLLMSDQNCEVDKDSSIAAKSAVQKPARTNKQHGTVVMPAAGSADDCSELKFQNGSVCVPSFTDATHESRNCLKLEESRTFNYSNVVHYITETWDVVIKEYEEGHNEQLDQHHAKIQYYSGEQ